MTSYGLTCDTWDESERKAIEKVIQSGRFTMGPAVKDFEAAFAEKMGKRYAVMVNSGSSANLISVAALCHKSERPLQRGDEVIVPAISWATTYHPLWQYGLKLRFVDVELESLNMDVSLLEKALTPNTRALMAVSILGNPAALDKMRAFCDKHGLAFIEDNCESLGARLNGKYCGTFGDLNTFSFFYSHHISTIEGGMILTDDRELYELCLCLRAHGWTRDLPADSVLFQKKNDDFFEAYRFILPGYNVRPTEINAAIGSAQLTKLDRMLKIRRDNAELFKAAFGKDERFIIQKENGESSWFSFTIIPRKAQRSEVLKNLKNVGIDYRIITGGNFLKHDVIKLYDYTIVNDKTPNADFAHSHGFFVGNFPYPMEKEIKLLKSALDGIAV
jgi:CDP-6-deoxy-D-xylo-4-hexulose-3-dehydrase